ncbi:MAG: ferredoxin [Actinomycetota bacterium]|nr:ferredoxin [Actinomycetota bacterium]
MHVVVDYRRCISAGSCTRAAPEVFELAADGTLHLLQDAPDESLRAQVEEAAEHCPTGAITVEG